VKQGLRVLLDQKAIPVTLVRKGHRVQLEQPEQQGRKVLRVILAIKDRRVFKVLLERKVQRVTSEIQGLKVQQAQLVRLAQLDHREQLDLKDHLELSPQALRWFTTQAHKL
jgi:hypothetical protein